MPNPKVGTVSPDVATAVKNAKAGQVRYRTDKNGIIHTSVGKVGFEAGKLKENVEALIADLKRINLLPRRYLRQARYPEHHHGPRSGHRSELAERVRTWRCDSSRRQQKLGSLPGGGYPRP